MPQHSFRLGLRFSLIGLAFSSAWGALLAADSETAIRAVEGAAERWGLWAAVALAMTGFAVYALYRQSVFIQDKLVSLIEDTRRALDRNTAAISNAPCGRRLQDDDWDDAGEDRTADEVRRKRPPGPQEQV